jgi:hypothetical protein
MNGLKRTAFQNSQLGCVRGDIIPGNKTRRYSNCLCEN